MAQNKRKMGGNPQNNTPRAASVGSVLSKLGWKLVGAGGGITILGFIILSLTDPKGQNWASQVSPFLIIGGYVLIGFGIVAKDPSNSPA